MAYPKRTEQRLGYWETQVTHTRRMMKPLFDACNVLKTQYYNEPSTEREANASDMGGDEEHVRRTKAGIIYGWIDQSIANMLDREPSFRCTPANRAAAMRLSDDPGAPMLSEVAAKINNYIYRETNQLRVDERVTLDAMLFPYGGVKIGYTVDYDAREQELLQPGVEIELDDPEDENLFLVTAQDVRVAEEHDHVWHVQVHQELLDNLQYQVGEEFEDAVQIVLKDHIRLHRLFHDRPAPSANTNVRRENPYAVRWEPDMLLTDAFSMEGMQDARWVAFGWELPIDEVLSDPQYENTRGLEPTRWNDAPAKDEQKLESDGFDVVRGWEIWAKNLPIGAGKFRNVVLTMAEGHEKFLRYDEEWPYDRLDDYPGEVLTFQPGMRRWFDKPPLLMGGADTTQALINEILDSYLNIIRKQKNIWLVDPSTGWTTKTIQDVLDMPDCSVVQVPGLSEAAGKSVLALPFHQVAEEKGQLMSVLQGIFDRSVGTPQPQQMPKTDTATEASIAEKRNTSRENRRSQLVSEFQVRKARKMLQLITQFKPPNLYLIDEQAPLFVEINDKLAEGEYLISIDVTSHSTALATERSQWMDLLNLFAGLTPVMMEIYNVPPNLAELARRLLVRGFDERTVEIVLPMLRAAAQQLPPEVAGGVSVMGQGNATEFANPGAQGAQEAVRDGRMVDKGIGPLQRDSYNRDVPNEGRQQGEANRG